MPATLRWLMDGSATEPLSAPVARVRGGRGRGKTQPRTQLPIKGPAYGFSKVLDSRLGPLVGNWAVVRGANYSKPIIMGLSHSGFAARRESPLSLFLLQAAPTPGCCRLSPAQAQALAYPPGEARHNIAAAPGGPAW